MKFSTRSRQTLAAALLLLPTAVPPARKPAVPGAAPQGKLDIRILVTAEPAKVFHPTKGPDGKYSQAQPVKVAPRNRPISALILFKDCKPDASGNCNVDVDIQGLTPSGALFKNQRGAELWRNKTAPHAGFTQLGSPHIKITVEPRDPAGVYRIIAVAHDRIAGTNARAEATFEVK